MDQDVGLGIVIGIIVIVLLGLVLYVNVSGILGFLSDPLIGEGLGRLCTSEQDSRDFCSNNRGRCNNYCQENPENALCGTLFGRIG